MAEHGGDIYRNEVDIDFSVNISPFGIPSNVREALQKSLLYSSTYPDPEYQELKCAIARMEGVDPEWIVCGNGASELFVAIARAISPKIVGLAEPCFSEYEKSLEASNSAKVHSVMLKEEEEFQVTKETIEALFSDNVNMVILGNPNNPTGRVLSKDCVELAIERGEEKKCVLVLDESFLPLTTMNEMDEIPKSPFLIRIKSFTKSMALPGIRIGYAIIENRKLREKIERQLPEWNVSVPATYAGIAASFCKNWLDEQIRNEREGLVFLRTYLYEGLEKLGFKAYPSDTNFVLFQAEEGLYEKLLDKRILIRKCDNYRGLSTHWDEESAKYQAFYRVAVKSLVEIESLLFAMKNSTSKSQAAPSAGQERKKRKRLLCVQPSDIEKTSFDILSKELAAKGIYLEGDKAPIIKRCIHTSADFEYAQTLEFSEGVVAKAKELIRGGAHLVTDTNMALSGINKRALLEYGCEAHCFMADEKIAKMAKERGCTRAAMSMEYASNLDGSVIFVIGNAPTALVALCDLIDKGLFRPDLVIGVPVGFVNVEVAKEMMMERGVPYIINRGRKGGSNVAAAICNAILYDMKEEVGR